MSKDRTHWRVVPIAYVCLKLSPSCWVVVVSKLMQPGEQLMFSWENTGTLNHCITPKPEIRTTKYKGFLQSSCSSFCIRSSRAGTPTFHRSSLNIFLIKQPFSWKHQRLDWLYWRHSTSVLLKKLKQKLDHLCWKPINITSSQICWKWTCRHLKPRPNVLTSLTIFSCINAIGRASTNLMQISP